MTAALRGIVGTPVTPFKADNKLDVDALAQLVDFEVNCGAHMLALPMHIGESLNLTTEERKQVAETTVKAVAGRVPVFVHVSLPATDQVIELAQHAEAVGAAGVVVVTPYHWRPVPDALRKHFVSVGRAIAIDLIAYNFPARLGVAITADLLVDLLGDLGNFAGMKDATYDMQWFTEACRITTERRPAFAMFTGVDYLLPSMPLGGAGCFSPCHAIAPNLINSLYGACRDGDYSLARELQYKASQLWHLLRTGYPASVKAAMKILSRPVGGVRLPLMDLAPETMLSLEEGLARLGILEEEPTGWEARMRVAGA